MESGEIVTSGCWVIGYGNPHRGDDGIGFHVVDQVEKAVNRPQEIQTRAVHQLDPALVEELQDAQAIVFVDASMDIIDKGWTWTRIAPEFTGFYHVTHLFAPSFLLGLIHALYERDPETWLVTVQGDNFDFKESLTPGAEKRAWGAAREILDFLDPRHRTKFTPSATPKGG